MAKEIQAEYLKALTKCFSQTTEKQLLSASLILTADVLSNIWIFKDDKVLHEQDLLKFLTTKAEVSQHERGYEFIFNWIAENENRFSDFAEGIIYGRIEDGKVIANVKPLEQTLTDNGFNYRSMLKWLGNNEKIIKAGNGENTQTQRLGQLKIPHRCVVFKVPD